MTCLILQLISIPIDTHTHTGSDFCRALLLFDEEKPLGENGLFWLKVHLSNLFGNNKIPHHERVRFVDSNMEKIIETAKDPLGMRDFWGEADEPFQALATILGKNYIHNFIHNFR